MIRLRNVQTGVVIRVDGDLASRLGSEWVAVDQRSTDQRSTRSSKAKAKPAPARPLETP